MEILEHKFLFKAEDFYISALEKMFCIILEEIQFKSQIYMKYFQYQYVNLHFRWIWCLWTAVWHQIKRWMFTGLSLLVE